MLLLLTLVLVIIFLHSSNSMMTLTSVEFSSVIILLLMGTSGTKESNSALNYLFRFRMFFGCLLFSDVLIGASINVDAIFLVGSVMGVSVVAFLSKLPAFSLHQWLPRAHVECTAMRSAILRGVFLKLRSRILNYTLTVRLLPLGLLLRLVSVVVMFSTVDFKIFVAFSSISHMTAIFTRVYLNMPIRVFVYLVVHTLLSAAMFWLYSKEYERVRTRLFTTFRIYSTVWLMFLWLGLPFFPVFITELRVVSTFFNLSFTAVVLLFSLLLLFCLVLLAFVNGGVITRRSVIVSTHRKYHLFERTLIFFLGWVLI